MTLTLRTMMDPGLVRALRMGAFGRQGATAGSGAYSSGESGLAPGIRGMIESLSRQLASQLGADRRPESSDGGLRAPGGAGSAAASTAPSGQAAAMGPEGPPVGSSRQVGDLPDEAQARAEARRPLPSALAAPLHQTPAAPRTSRDGLASALSASAYQASQRPQSSGIHLGEPPGAVGLAVPSLSFADGLEAAGGSANVATIINDNRRTVHINQNYPIWQRDKEHNRLLRGDMEQ